MYLLVILLIGDAVQTYRLGAWALTLERFGYSGMQTVLDCSSPLSKTDHEAICTFQVHCNSGLLYYINVHRQGCSSAITNLRLKLRPQNSSESFTNSSCVLCSWSCYYCCYFDVFTDLAFTFTKAYWVLAQTTVTYPCCSSIIWPT